jgi:hypothetical protein
MPVCDDVLQIWTTLKELATKTENTAQQFCHDKSSIDDEGRYCRFNVDHSLEDIEIELKESKKEITVATARRIASQVTLKQTKAYANNFWGSVSLAVFQS